MFFVKNRSFALGRSLARHRHHDVATVVERKIQEESYVSSLRRSGSVKEVCDRHAEIVRDGYGQSVVLGDVLVQAYGKHGGIDKARVVFDGLGRKNAFSWTVLIAAYAQNGHPRQALGAFKAMDVKPSRYTYLVILGACSELKALSDGRVIHSQILAAAAELGDDVCLHNAVVNMYAKCGNLNDARAAFDAIPRKDVVSWNSMVSAYAQRGESRLALELYHRMEPEGVKPDEYTFSSVLSACSSYEEGREIHKAIVSSGTHSSNNAIQNALIDMYTRCHRLVEAKEVFDRMQRKNVISWTAMISAYTQHDEGRQAVLLFRKMDLEGVVPNNVTFATVITACSNEGMLAQGRAIHSRIRKPDFVVQNTLLNLYGKCGRLEEARSVFEEMKFKSVITWTTLVAAYAQQGHSMEALELSRKMDLDGVLPNSVTFGCILVACSYGGLLDQGWTSFTSMLPDYGIEPAAEHYVCMVDVLGRAGRVFEAEDLVHSIPAERGPLGWLALLGACRNQADAERGTRAAHQAYERYRKQSGLLVLLSDVFARSEAAAQ
ncbi:pentatricopeptide repeat-containing protein At1g15510, chloroplastic [Selaginella moellendorffii]|nr:pentatricopeptide repeat-containing protein At1g15510, chloroplastic [Selaginella moellendorffii]|eukprot:XP_024543394.1 pentatricopeptide repeat-containing protein At1g15510, chloroplastic [Selaginella moellendorffii]